MTKLPALRPLLASGQTAEALKQLLAWAEGQSPAWRQAALLLQAGWVQNEREFNAGTISYDEAARMRNRITQGAVGLLDRIESGSQSSDAALEELKNEFLNDQIAQVLEQNNTNISGNQINAHGSKVVVVGTGNTVTKQIFTALGSRQFLGILLGLTVLILGGYYGLKTLSGQQAAAFVSLSDIQKELSVLADLNAGVRAGLDANKGELEGWLTKAMTAMKDGDFPVAVQYLEQVAVQAPLATVHQNLAYAYEQLGNAEKARENLNTAQTINPNLDISKSYAQLKGKRINLLAPENGGKILVSSSENLTQMVDGLDRTVVLGNNEFAVFSFKDKKAASFDRFTYLVTATDASNFLDFELSYGNDSPTGTFQPIGKFKALNALLSETPFQEFSFSPVTAKYFKVQFQGSSSGGFCYEMQLLGELK
ncbi:MAG: tetratricopeptide repeat protein [Saprospirales bacterium]|nr:tetratricopeptide repeat protein [Saprospirales bacterium]